MTTRSRFVAPIAVFSVLVLLLAAGLRHNPRILPSALMDKSAPAFSLPTLDGVNQMIDTKDLRGHVTLFNVWASWCVGCRAEHDLLVELSRDSKVRIVGMNYKDQLDDARRWLQYYGNPYVMTAFDREGRVGIDFGVYGVPETFVIDKSGVIRYKHVGPLDRNVLDQTVMPLVRRLSEDRT